MKKFLDSEPFDKCFSKERTNPSSSEQENFRD